MYSIKVIEPSGDIVRVSLYSEKKKLIEEWSKRLIKYGRTHNIIASMIHGKNHKKWVIIKEHKSDDVKRIESK